VRSQSPFTPRRFVTLLGIVISIACVAWIVPSLDLEELVRELKDVNPFHLFTAILLTILSYFARAWRWPFFFGSKAPNLIESYRCLILGFFMNNVLPARMGEFVRAHLVGRATRQSRSIALATIAAERLADGVTISLIFAILFTFASREAEASGAEEIFYAVYLFIAATIVAALTLAYRHYFYRLLERLGHIMPGHISKYTLARIKRFIQGLEPLMHSRRLIVLGAQSMIVWGIEMVVYFEVARAFDQPLSLGGVALFLAAVNFSSLIPAAPGGIGVIEAFASLALVHIGVPREKALAMVGTQHLIQYLVVCLPGAYFTLKLGLGKLLMLRSSEADEENVSQDKEIEIYTRKLPIGDVDVSIVLPAYNEEVRLPKTLLSIINYFKKHPRTYEVIVVDDGSKDGTARVVEEMSGIFPEVSLIRLPQNRGKGFAVRTGMLAAVGRRVLYNDADGASPIEEIERLDKALNQGAQVAIGSRAMYSRETTIETNWHRKFMGRIFNGVVNILVLPGVADTQCGFKMFTKAAAQHIFSRQKAERFSFDVEILFLARKNDFKITEVPINWANVPGSKVNLFADSLQMFLDVVKFRLTDFMGGYETSGLVETSGSQDT